MTTGQLTKDAILARIKILDDLDGSVYDGEQFSKLNHREEKKKYKIKKFNRP
jgi:hypothetical protein